jgi:hypothetical protein
MKKTVLLMILLIIFSIAFTGCSSTQKENTSYDIPYWLNNFQPDDVLWGIATAKMPSDSLSMTVSETRAKAVIIRLIDTIVQEALIDYYLETGNDINQENISLMENISQQIKNVDVTNILLIEHWKSPDDSWWCLVELKVLDAKAIVADILKNQEAAFADFEAQTVIVIFDVKLDNEKNILDAERRIAIEQWQQELEERIRIAREQRRRQQAETWLLIANSMRAFADAITVIQNPSSGGDTGTVSSSSSGSTSSSRSQRTGDWGNYQRQYNRREKDVEAALDNYRRNPSESLLQSFRRQQNGLKNLRQELNRRIESQGGRANYISASYYETVNP